MTRTIVPMLGLAFILGAADAAGQSLASDADRRRAFQHYRAGQELLLTERFDLAAEEFRGAIRFEPLFTDAHYGLGQSLMGAQRYVRAIQAFGQCIEAAKRMHGLRERDRVANERAIDDEIRELRETRRRLAANGQVLKAMQIEQRIDEVERSRSSLGTGFETPASVLLALGSAHFRTGDRSTAEHYWSEAVRVNRDLGEGWNNLAVVYLASGRAQDAHDAVRNAERAGFRVNPQLKLDIRALK